MNINLRKISEEQLWLIYGQFISDAAKVKDEIQRRTSKKNRKIIHLYGTKKRAVRETI